MKTDAANVVALLADDEALAADVLVGLADARPISCVRVTLCPRRRYGSTLDLILLRLAAEARDVDDAGDLLELPLEDPILRGLQFRRVSRCRRR